MQQQNETFRNFLERTDCLASRLGIDLGELMDVLDMGRASFFSYRTGKRPISRKAWNKLEAAERSAGVGLEPEIEEDDSPSHSVPEDLHDRIERIENLLLRIAEKLDIPIEP